MTVNMMSEASMTIARFGLTVELMAVEVLRSRVTLPATFMGTIEFLVQPFPAALPFPRLSVLWGFRSRRVLSTTSSLCLPYRRGSAVLSPTPRILGFVLGVIRGRYCRAFARGPILRRLRCLYGR